MGKAQTGLSRRDFLSTSAAALGAAGLSLGSGGQAAAQAPSGKLKIALVGTGGRGSSLWGRDLLKDFGDVVDFVLRGEGATAQSVSAAQSTLTAQSAFTALKRAFGAGAPAADEPAPARPARTRAARRKRR